MVVPDAAYTYAGRLATFQVEHPVSKKRPSSAKAAKKLKWPHQNPSPEDLAKAGFFYSPTASSPDNVRCFLCRKCLDGWEEDDNPFAEHLQHSPECGWAINAAIRQRMEDTDRKEEHPLSEKMIEARRATFLGKWPHDGKRGWVCKIDKMVEAGWYYCPTPDSDDFVSCPYCDLSLDGWEPKDDPMDEHTRRSNGCLFFALINETSIGDEPSRSKKPRASKASRISTQSVLTVASDNPSFPDTHMGDDSLMSTDTRMSTGSVVVTGNAKATRSKKAAKGPKTGRGRAKKDTDVMEGIENELPHEKEPDPSARKTRGKKRPSDEMSMTMDETSTILTQDNPEPPAKRRATRQRSSMMRNVEEPVSQMNIVNDEHIDVPMTVDAEEIKPAKKGGKRTTRQSSRAPKSRKSTRISSASKTALEPETNLDDDMIDAALEADLNLPLTDDEEPMEAEETTKPRGRRLTRTKPSQRKTRVTGASEKVEAIHDTSEKDTLAVQDIAPELPHEHTFPDQTAEEDPEPDRPSRQAKPTRAKSTKKGSTKQRGKKESQAEGPISVSTDAISVEKPSETVQESETTDLMVSAPGQGQQVGGIQGNKTRSAGRSSRRTRSATGPEVLEDTESKTEKSTVSSVTSGLQQEAVEDLEAVEAVPQPKKKSAAAKTNGSKHSSAKGKSRKKAPEESVVVQDSASETAVIPEASAPAPKEATPPASPQSSDAENQPPSSRPSFKTSQQSDQVTQTPTKPSTPTKSPSNPSKMAGGLRSTIPWTAVDLEAIFLPSPSETENKENALVKKISELTSPEKRMDVEQWIYHNAKKGEEQLRNECERLVGLFEQEGVRALRVLESIDVE